MSDGPYNVPVQIGAGTILHKRYRIRSQIGAGGMGLVYEAVDLRLHNTVAVKQLRAPGYDAAFRQEAQMLAALRHPGLPVVSDYFAEADALYLVMQYIEGEDLEHLLKRSGRPCSQSDVVSWGVAILEVLVYLHERDQPIIHRDIKPGNIKRTPRGDVVLLDFGLAKGRLDDQTHLEDARSVYGYTRGYAPLEQVEGRGTVPQSDLYALGATLFHLATNVRPASAESRARALADGRPDPLVPAATLNHTLRPEFSLVLEKALALEPGARYESARAMRDALSRPSEGHRPPRQTEELSGVRRVDAAIPSRGEVGRQLDLLVQVRFAGSPLLGLEDWPTGRKPESVQQGSEAMRLDHPVDPRTGRLLPARLRIKLVAPDFLIEGTEEHLIEVAPDQYSPRVVFLLTPRRTGYCRVNVEVYALDSLYLGTIPVEAEAVAVAVANPVYRVANLVLGIFTRSAPPEAAPRATPLVNVDLPAVTPGPVQWDARRVPDDAAPPELPEETPGALGSASAPSSRKWLLAAAPPLLLVTVLFLFRQSDTPVPTASVRDPSASLPASPGMTGRTGAEPPPPPTPSSVSTPPAVEPRLASPPQVMPVLPRVVSSDGSIELEVSRVERLGAGRLRLHLTFRNRRTDPMTLSFDRGETRLSGHPVVNEALPDSRSETTRLQVSAVTRYWFEFDVPAGATGLFELVLVPPANGSGHPRFPPVTVAVPSR